MIEKRNMAASDAFMLVGPQQAQWSEWTVRKAVKDGYKASSWVYRAVSIIASNAASVPWVVYGADNEAIWTHPVSKMLAKPNPNFSRGDFFFLAFAWMALAGRAPLRRVDGLRGMPSELWPISPDRIAPKPSADPTKWIDGYEIIDGRGIKRLSEDYTVDNVLYPKLIDPANPYDGISPLMAASRAADLDVSAQDWNVAVMQNRGVPEGLFSFKRNLDESLVKAILRRIKERWSGISHAREPMVIGDEATYTRLSLSPVELDYLETRKFSREEIYIVYGVPPQLGGSQESSTYNNFATSNRIFWEGTVIPTYLSPVKDVLSSSFAGQLSPGQWIGYDLSNVAAMTENETERATTAKIYVDMGVPMEQVNEKFELGLKPWDGWDKPAPIKGQAGQQPADAGQRSKPRLLAFERRNLETEMASRDAYAEGPLQAAIAHLLDEDRKAVFAALETGGEAAEAAKESRKAWQAVIQQGYTTVAYDAAARMMEGQRGAPMADLERRAMQQPEDTVQQAINEALAEESIILSEISFISSATVDVIVAQVVHAVENGLPVSTIQQALTDTGIFSPERALRIARTVSGAAMGVGQMTAGHMAGATHKVWHTGGINVRDWHSARAGEKVKIDGRFSARAGSSVGPRYPCDPQVSGADRINCKCAMSFAIED